jgi:hypothetical protein
MIVEEIEEADENLLEMVVIIIETVAGFIILEMNDLDPLLTEVDVALRLLFKDDLGREVDHHLFVKGHGLLLVALDLDLLLFVIALLLVALDLVLLLFALKGLDQDLLLRKSFLDQGPDLVLGHDSY